MTFLELIETVMSDLDEPLNDVNLVSRVKNYINRGYKELAKREGLLRVSTKTVSNSRIKKPTEAAKVYGVFQEDNSIAFNDEGAYLYLNATGDVKIVYNYIPDPLESDEDETETNIANDEFIINFAKWLYFINDALEEEARIFKTEYESMQLKRSQADTVKIVDVYGVM